MYKIFSIEYFIQLAICLVIIFAMVFAMFRFKDNARKSAKISICEIGFNR